MGDVLKEGAVEFSGGCLMTLLTSVVVAEA